MILKKILCFQFLFILALNLKAQYNPFFQMYGGSNEVAILSMDTTRDGGYILNAVDQNSSGGDFLVIKTDVNGNEEWRYRNIKFDGLDSSNVMFTIDETLYKGYLVGGMIERDFSLGGNYSDAFIVMLDSIGNLVWEKSFNFSPGEKVDATYIKSDSSYILAIRLVGKQKLMNLDNNGDTLWTSEIINPGGTILNVDKIYEIDSCFYLLCFCDSLSISFNYSRIIKTDNLGHQIWQKSYIDTSGSKGNSYWFASDSTFLINSYMYSPSSLYYTRQIKIGLQGDVQDTLYPNIYGVYDSDSTIMFNNSGNINFDSLYIGRANYNSGQIQTFASLYIPNLGIHDIVLDRNRNILSCGSQDVFGKVGVLIKAVDTLLNTIVPKTYLGTKYSVSVFPNPATEWININVDGINDYKFELYNNLGNVVLTYHDFNERKHTLKVSNLPKGFYYYRIVSKKQKIACGKIIIN